MKDFRDKVVVVTGAGSGIGRELAVKLAQKGAKVAISDVDAAGLATTERLVREAQVGARDFQFFLKGLRDDLTRRESAGAQDRSR